MAENLTLVKPDLNIYACSQIQLHQGIHGLVGRIEDIHQSLVRAQLVLVPRVLVDVRRNQDGIRLALGRQGDRALDSGTGPLRSLDDLGRGTVISR